MIIWSLFDGSGLMGQPWADNGHTVYCFNADEGNHGEYKTKARHPNIHYVNQWIDKDFIIKCELLGIPKPSIVFGFPDCTLFAQSGSQHGRDDQELQYALANARLIKEIGELYGVPWMVENPVGKLSRPEMMGKPSAYFHPWQFGGHMSIDDEPFHPKMPRFDGYTKKTCLWFGNGFVMPPVKPGPINIGCFWGWKFLGGNSAKTKQLRSLTPRGFARAVYESNKGV